MKRNNHSVLKTFTWKLVVCFTIVFGSAEAQHFQFSQFYASPTYLNPAFTGANVCGRASLIYRNQWTGIPGTFTSYQFSFDHYLRAFKSGIGIQLFSDRAGIGSLKTTQISLLYAYETRINKRMHARGGISVGSVQRSIDYSSFVFGDQIARESPNSLEGIGVTSINYFDVGAGMLLYSSSKWLGVSFNHLNRPNQGLTNIVSTLPMETMLHGGYRMTINEFEKYDRRAPNITAVTFAFNLKNQNKFNQMDLGIYFSKDFFVIGGWYRGIPLTKPNGQDPNTDAIICLVGINLKSYKIGYSYDYTISKLNNANSRGSHEISMAYQFCKFKISQRKSYRLISCPKF